MRILAADDDRASLTMLESIIRQSGHEPVLAENGNKAWEILTSKDPPTLAILDWLMPGIDGETLCRMIRKDIAKRPVYVIMLTVKSGKADVVRGLEAGANDYLAKPFDSGELYSRIRVGIRTLDLESRLSARIMDLELKDRKVQTLLAEKELILFEVHHRVKNNMNMIVNLLSMQSDAMDDEAARSALMKAIARLKTMGILYDKLYRSDNVNAISMREYLPRLIDEIISVFPDRYKVDLDVDVDEIVLDVQRMSCVGMIVNELMFNTMKHAFAKRGNGSVTLVASLANGIVTVRFEDDGTGLPESVNLEHPQTFGLKLVIGLAAQIGGTISLHRNGGMRATLTFPI